MNVLAPLPVGTASERMETLQREMKQAALDGDPPPRRFEPQKDGWWDGYRYEIDPAFPELAERVSRHREELGDR
jgi:1-acyl-sn-glycerol-3-phosphate acyltransferase